jgi:hypothetical protein
MALLAETQSDLWPCRDRTVALLKRYAHSSVEVGRLPSLLGREFFRSRAFFLFGVGDGGKEGTEERRFDAESKSYRKSRGASGRRGGFAG